MMEGYSELERYISSESELRQAEKKLQLNREHIYSMTTPQIDVTLGRIEYVTLRIDKAVTNVIEVEEYHEQKYKNHYQTRKLLHEALQTLNSMEYEAYERQVWDKPTTMTVEKLNELGGIVSRKLCNYIAENHLIDEQIKI